MPISQGGASRTNLGSRGAANRRSGAAEIPMPSQENFSDIFEESQAQIAELLENIKIILENLNPVLENFKIILVMLFEVVKQIIIPFLTNLKSLFSELFNGKQTPADSQASPILNQFQSFAENVARHVAPDDHVAHVDSPISGFGM